MRSPEPVEGVPDAGRYSETNILAKGDSGTYNYRPITLEEEVYNGGWFPGARPTGPKPNDLFTLGMRGEPGWNDDPQFNNGSRTVTHEGGKAPQDISDVD